jgi:excisionase family DNA binding protein
METRLLTLNQLAERTGLPAAWLKRETDAGRLRCIRAGRSRLFDLSTVLKALTERPDGEAPRGK